MHFPTLLSFCSLLLAGGPPYSAVVVDATTNRPLANVSVRGADASGTRTDARGVFTLPATGGEKLSLSCLGYAALAYQVPATPGRADTLRLLPQAYVLADVAVRPPRAQVFSSAPAEGAEIKRGVLPGQAVALLVKRPAGTPADQPCILNQATVYLSDKPSEGRLRVRLVNIQHQDNHPDQPGANDLLPTPLVFTTEQLRHLDHNKLTVDLSQYNLLLPAEGLCVVVDGLPTDPSFDAVSTKANEKGKVTVVVKPHAGGAPQSFPADDFPHLIAKRDAGTQTWSRTPNHPEWSAQSTMYYTVRADVSVYSY